MEGFGRCFLDRPGHSFGPAVGPGMIGFGEAMLDAVALAGAPEDVADPGLRHPLLAIDEMDAIVGQDGLDLVGYGPDQNLEECGSGQLGGFAVDAHEDQLRGAVHHDEQEALAAFVTQFGDVDVEVADLVILELLRLLAVRLGQPADSAGSGTATSASAAGSRPSGRCRRHPAGGAPARAAPR